MGVQLSGSEPPPSPTHSHCGCQRGDSTIITMMYDSPWCPLLFAPAPVPSQLLLLKFNVPPHSFTFKVLCIAYPNIHEALTLLSFRQIPEFCILCHQGRFAGKCAGMLYCPKECYVTTERERRAILSIQMGCKQ